MNDKNSKINTTLKISNQKQQKDRTTFPKIVNHHSNDHDNKDDNDKSSTLSTTVTEEEKPDVVVVELPPFAVIRGSITHKIAFVFNSSYFA